LRPGRQGSRPDLSRNSCTVAAVAIGFFLFAQGEADNAERLLASSASNDTAKITSVQATQASEPAVPVILPLFDSLIGGHPLRLSDHVLVFRGRDGFAEMSSARGAKHASRSSSSGYGCRVRFHGGPFYCRTVQPG